MRNNTKSNVKDNSVTIEQSNVNKIKACVELYLTVGMEMYVIATLAYAALAWSGYAPTNSISRRVSIASFGMFAVVRLAVALARNRRVIQ